MKTNLSEFIAALHNEVEKSYSFIEESKQSLIEESKQNNISNSSILHMNIERIEIDLPAQLSHDEVDLIKENVNLSVPDRYRRLLNPFISIPTGDPKKQKGTTIKIETIDEISKLDDRVKPEVIGRIKIIFKPIIS